MPDTDPLQIMTERVARILGRPAAEAMRDASLLEYQLMQKQQGATDGEA